MPTGIAAVRMPRERKRRSRSAVGAAAGRIHRAGSSRNAGHWRRAQVTIPASRRAAAPRRAGRGPRRRVQTLAGAGLLAAPELRRMSSPAPSSTRSWRSAGRRPSPRSSRSPGPRSGCRSRWATTSTSTPRSSTPRTSGGCVPARRRAAAGELAPPARRLPRAGELRRGVRHPRAAAARSAAARRARRPAPFARSRRLDIELESGFVTGPGNALGTAIATAEAPGRIFGFVLVNDWSARDI
jgi:fumarylacetoacetase-like protein